MLPTQAANSRADGPDLGRVAAAVRAHQQMESEREASPPRRGAPSVERPVVDEERDPELIGHVHGHEHDLVDMGVRRDLRTRGEELAEDIELQVALDPLPTEVAREIAPWLLAVIVVVALAAGFSYYRRLARRRRKENAHDVAMSRLAKIEARGFPSAADAAAWYVELSSIIRRYLEDRYSVRAPELAAPSAAAVPALPPPMIATSKTSRCGINPPPRSAINPI